MNSTDDLSTPLALFEHLRSTLGNEYNILVLAIGSAAVYRSSRWLQRRVEEALFVQILIGGPTAEDEAQLGGGGDQEQFYAMLEQGMDPDDIDGASSRAAQYAAQQRQQEAERLVDDVRMYAARCSLESTNPLRLLFPLPVLRVTSQIDSATLWDDDAEGVHLPTSPHISPHLPTYQQCHPVGR